MNRRTLEFQSLDQAVADAKRLCEIDCHSVGKWNYVQVCGHLEDWLRFATEGFPKQSFPVRAILWMMKVTMGRSMIKKILSTKSMKAGSPTMPETVKKPDDQSKAEAFGRFEIAIENFKNHEGEYCPSPLFGQLSREDALLLQLIHCAHHLSFLVPVDE